jgi:hypothetical protein
MFPAFALRARALVFPKLAAAGSCDKALLIAIVVAISQKVKKTNGTSSAGSSWLLRALIPVLGLADSMSQVARRCAGLVVAAANHSCRSAQRSTLSSQRLLHAYSSQQVLI